MIKGFFAVSGQRDMIKIAQKGRTEINGGNVKPWVPEPQKINERKLVRGKERKKGSFFPSLFFLLIIFWLW